MLTAAAISGAAGAEMISAVDVSDQLNAGRQTTPGCAGKVIEGHRPELRWDDQLAKTAAAHAQDMANNKYFAHRSPGGADVRDRANDTGYNWRTLGEILAMGPKDFATAIGMWLKSNKHCEVLIDPSFVEFGAAAVKPPSGSTYWVVVFGQRKNPR